MSLDRFVNPTGGLNALLFCSDVSGRIVRTWNRASRRGIADRSKGSETLRYAVRTDGKRGFVFINNYQDHEITPDKKDETIILTLKDEIISFSDISIAGDENCIFPFHMDLCGMDLVSATAQPVTYVENEGERTYVFMRPRRTKAKFLFI